MRLPEETSDLSGPNLTPVIDIVFLLLIFFLVATRYNKEEQERETEIDLPEITQAEPLMMSRELVVSISRDGRYKALKREWQPGDLKTLIQKAHEKNPHRSVLIASDQETPIKHAIRVKGYCNEVGIKCRVAAVQAQKL